MRFNDLVWRVVSSSWPPLAVALCLFALAFVVRRQQAIRMLLLSIAIAIMVITALVAILTISIAASLNA